MDAVGGPDTRWAILPAVLGWAVTLVAMAMLAARAFADPSRAALAGGLAVALAATSPAFAWLGTDAMMELPGAALTMLVLLAATAGPLPWRRLAVLLTLLALHYWTMAVAAVLAAQTRFVETAAQDVPPHAAHVAWWRTASPPSAAPPRRRGLVEIAAALLALATITTLLLPRRPGGQPCASG